MSTKAYRDSHKAEMATYQKAYRKAHNTELTTYRKAYSAANKMEQAAYDKAYREEHKDKLAENQKARRAANSVKIVIKNKAYRDVHKAEKAAYDKTYRKIKKAERAAARAAASVGKQPRMTRKERMRIYRKANKARIAGYARKYHQSAKYKTNIVTRLRKNLRTRVGRVIKSGQRGGSAVRDLGCKVVELKEHLAALWQPGMTWDNFGREGWVLDHIKPLALFDLTDRSQFLEATHHTNLQPLWAEQNLEKRDSYDPSPDWKWLARNIIKEQTYGYDSPQVSA